MIYSGHGTRTSIWKSRAAQTGMRESTVPVIPTALMGSAANTFSSLPGYLPGSRGYHYLSGAGCHWLNGKLRLTFVRRKGSAAAKSVRLFTAAAQTSVFFSNGWYKGQFSSNEESFLSITRNLNSIKLFRK